MTSGWRFLAILPLFPLQWCCGVSSHQQLECLSNSFFFHDNMKGNIRITGPMGGESTDDRRIPLTKWPVMRKACPCDDFVMLQFIANPSTAPKLTCCRLVHVFLIVRRAGLLWSQQDFEWRWSVPLFKCLTVLEFSFILFDLCLLITFFNFIMNYVPIVTFWIFTYHKIWILSIMFCFIWSYWIIYFLACLEVSWRVVS